MNNSISTKLKAAQEFLGSKERIVYTKVTALCEFNFDVEEIYLNQIDEEKMAALKNLVEKHGKNGYLEHLSEVFSDEDELHDLSGGQKITGIDLDAKYYQYEFTIREFEKDETVTSHSELVELTDSEYAELLGNRLNDQRFTINTLKYTNRTLFEKITRDIDGYFVENDGMFLSWHDAPYTVTMDEVNRDAETILLSHPEWRLGSSFRSYCF